MPELLHGAWALGTLVVALLSFFAGYHFGRRRLHSVGQSSLAVHPMPKPALRSPALEKRGSKCACLGVFSICAMVDLDDFCVAGCIQNRLKLFSSEPLLQAQR
jgi:hypothetical protein